ncbi:putative neck protein [Campylobacter phage F370]|uniref:Putative neck protein n=5 Tax=Fletchervirus TaxID=1636618 RepID=A0A7T3KHT3_9CAUD|nr:putative neck protein [Campylobacter phage F348]QPX63351.1 putative neck protein [Campylobacter phage F352]QPX64999.1 putative neck protein [Campylobacter phage F370]QPX65162.1 putative neck protein [Campylobacter phage F371]QPX65327.1 putative neck protein [Campylobacter phage F372]QPX65487.1 putative neck protein [Campylobacter phage F374]QPX65654.1 putative neck protein [Campylobacter phage F375]QXO06089.1 hypothetical protein [Campylobacter phage CJLB-10]
MAWNLNNRQNEYQLFGTLSAEIIDMYGFQLTYIKTKRLGHDKVLDDIINYGTEATYQIFALPENAEMFDERGDILNKFGIFTMDSMNLFISANTMKRIFQDESKIPSAVGDILLLPSGKYIEITSIEHQVPGANNQFTYSNSKNVYMLRCKSFNYNHDNIPTLEEVNNEEVNESLDEIFNLVGSAENSKDKIKEEQDKESPLVKGTDSVFGYLDS